MSFTSTKRNAIVSAGARFGWVFGLFLWAVCAWSWLRPRQAASDLMGWRQADTQTIALHLTEPGSSLFYPQVDWGGDGPGYVETELQLYGALAAGLMRVLGKAEWVSQLLSLGCVVGAAVVVWFHCSRAYGRLPATLGVGAFLSARAVTQLATAIQPDGLSLLAFCVAWSGWVRYVRTDRNLWLGAFAVFGGIAMLVKPTAAQIGIASGVMALLQARHLLKKFGVWFSWLAMVAVFAGYLLHARSLYLEYGNTFGMLSGGDSKTPRLEQLLLARNYLHAARNAVVWGTSWAGLVALLLLAFRRRLDGELLALAVGNACMTLVALRYTSTPAGLHYFAPASMLGAVAVARLSGEYLASRQWLAPLTLVLSCPIGIQLLWSACLRHRDTKPDPMSEPVIALGTALARVAKPRDLVVIRSSEDAYDRAWNTPNNFQDPRAFYVSGTRGWALGRDENDPQLLEGHRQRGARFYAEPEAPTDETRLAPWLSTHAELVATTSYRGRIFRLSTP